MDTLPIDGAFGEGGGQILRTSLSLSALTGRPIEIHHIRGGRSRPGLRPQHLAAVEAAAAICAARTEGAEVGSGHLWFTPQCQPAPGDYHFAIGTAGAATLVLQTVLLPLALAGGPSRVTVTGGTHVPFAPTADYLEAVFLAALRPCGLAVTLALPSAGYFPRGGGRLTAEILPLAAVLPLERTERGKIESLSARVTTSGLPPAVGERGIAALREALRKAGTELTAQAVSLPSSGPGAALTLLAHAGSGSAGFTALGERGKPIEQVAGEAVAAFQAWEASGMACDSHLADQLALPLALSPGESRWTTAEVTPHLRTVLWLIPQFLPRTLTLQENADGTGRVRVTADQRQRVKKRSGRQFRFL